MYWIVAIMTASLLGVIGTGIYLEYRPLVRPRRVPWMRGAVLTNLVVFFVAQCALLFLGVSDALAQPAGEAAGLHRAPGPINASSPPGSGCGAGGPA